MTLAYLETLLSPEGIAAAVEEAKRNSPMGMAHHPYTHVRETRRVSLHMNDDGSAVFTWHETHMHTNARCDE